MTQKLVLITALFCTSALGMDSNNADNGNEPEEKKARTETSSPEESDSDSDVAVAVDQAHAINNGDKPLLHIAIKKRNPDHCMLLIGIGADINVIFDGEPAFHAAAYKGLDDVCAAMVEKGINVHALDDEGNSPLHWAATRNAKLVQKLIDCGAKVHVQNYDGETPLHWAASAEICKLLVRNGANINARDKNGGTPLYQAVLSEDIPDEVSVSLLELGADVNAATSDGKTALWWAVREGHNDLCVHLLEKGANVNGADCASLEHPHRMCFEGCTPLHVAVTMCFEDTSAPAEFRCKLLLDKGANVNAPDNNGCTPLHRAIKGGEYDRPEGIEERFCKLLIAGGANIRARDKKGQTPVHYAAQSALANVCTQLLEKEVGINARDNDGNTPLHSAGTHLCHIAEVYRVLIKYGADVNALNNDRKTPLGILIDTVSKETASKVSYNHLDQLRCILTTLLKSGAYACIFPTFTHDKKHKQRLLTTLCVFKRLRPQISKEASLEVLARVPDLRDCIVSSLLARVQKNIQMKVQPLQGIPFQFHGLVISAIYRHTMHQIQRLFVIVTPEQVDVTAIENEVGQTIYNGIVWQLKSEAVAPIQAIQEPQVELFPV